MRDDQAWARFGLALSLVCIVVGALLGMSGRANWAFYFVNYWLGSATVYGAALRRAGRDTWV